MCGKRGGCSLPLPRPRGKSERLEEPGSWCPLQFILRQRAASPPEEHFRRGCSVLRRSAPVFAHFRRP